ncbi:unnamed protein product, partial [Rotaria socialis]
MIVLSQQILDYANELRQAARDLHRLQSKYEPLPATSDANTTTTTTTTTT